jgi:hypothetical protein
MIASTSTAWFSASRTCALSNGATSVGMRTNAHPAIG